MLKCTNHYNYGHHNNHNHLHHWTYAIAINIYNTYICMSTSKIEKKSPQRLARPRRSRSHSHKPLYLDLAICNEILRIVYTYIQIII